MTIMVMEKGDEALKKVSLAINNTLLSHREDDLVARYGGEEFVVLIKNIDETGLNHMAELLVKAIRDEKIEHNFSKVAKHVTISLGAVLYDAQNSLDLKTIMKIADEALYEVKQKSRNNFLIKIA